MRQLSFPLWLVATPCLLLPLGGQAQPATARDPAPAASARPLNLSLPRAAPGQLRMGVQEEPRRLPLPGPAVRQDEPAAWRGAGELRYGIGYEARQSGPHGGALPGGGATPGGVAAPAGGAARGRGP